MLSFEQNKPMSFVVGTIVINCVHSTKILLVQFLPIDPCNVIALNSLFCWKSDNLYMGSNTE